MTEQVHRRVLRWFARRRLLNPDDARGTLAWNNGGFSLDASVRMPVTTGWGWSACCAAAHGWSLHSNGSSACSPTSAR